MKNFNYINHCRMCGKNDLIHLISFRPTPPANEYVASECFQEKFPLDILQCKFCNSCQLSATVNPDKLFSEYKYVSGTSKSFVKHFENYASAVAKRGEIRDKDLVIDIGSNDGTLLEKFMTFTGNVIGIEPASSIAKEANRKGIYTINSFLNKEVVSKILLTKGKAKVITSNNCLAHIDDFNNTLKLISELLDSNGMLVFEVSYLPNMLAGTYFDLCYSEHIFYHHLHPLKQCLEKYDLEIINVDKVPVHGGSIRVYAAFKNHKKKDADKVSRILKEEEDLNFPNSIECWTKFEIKVKKAKKSLRDYLSSSNNKIIGFGSPAKLTTLFYEFGLDDFKFEYIIDDSSWKQGLMTPGSNIPIVDSSRLKEETDTTCVVFAWNFSEDIVKNNNYFLDNENNEFVVPLPDLQIIRK